MHFFCLKPDLRLYFWVTLLFLPGYTCAQNQTPAEYDIKWVQLPDLSANRSISDVFQDHCGLLWIGSKSGLYRYDGLSVQAYHLAPGDTVLACPIRAIQEDSAANLWVATDKGLKILNPTRSALIPLSNFNLPPELTSAPHTHLCKGAGNSFYIAIGKNIYEYRSRQFRLRWTLPFEDDYIPLLFEYNVKDRFLCINRTVPLAQSMTIIEVETGIILDPYLYEEKTQLYSTWVNIASLSCAFEADSLGLFFDYLEQTDQKSPMRYNPSGHCFIFQSKQQQQTRINQEIKFIQDFAQKNRLIAQGGQSGFKVRDIHHLSDNVSVYVSSEGAFILQPKNENFKTIKATLNKRIRAIQGDRYGHLIYGTYNDTYWQYPDEEQAHLLKSEYLSWAITPINSNNDAFVMEDGWEDKWWFHVKATSSNVSIKKAVEMRPTDAKVRSITYLSMAEDKLRQGIWHYFYRPDGCCSIVFYDKKEDKHYVQDPFCHYSDPRSMIAGEDLWIAGPDGIKRFIKPDPQSGRLNEDTIYTPVFIRSLPALTMYRSAGGTIWIGVDGRGLFSYWPDSGRFEQFTMSEGLPDNSIYSIIGEAGDSVLWLGTGKGLSRFDVRKKLFNNYNTEDGLPSNEFNTASTYRAPDGTIYMGGQNGITRFNPGNFKSRPQPLRQTAFLSMMGGGGGDDIRTYFLSDGDRQEVPPDIQLVQITFHTDDYLHAEQQQFRYRIPGLIDRWQTLAYTEKALFPYLPFGTHVLEVQTQTYRGIWLPASYYTLDVLPPWYATWWFRTLLLLGIAGLLYGLYLLRIRTLRREFALRQQISHDLHDDLGSRIFLLRTLSHKITNPLLSDADKQADLDRFEATSQETFKSIRDFIWAFDPKQDEAYQLFDRMDNFAENYLLPIINDVRIHRLNVPKGIKIGPRVKHHLMNIYQELLTNMVKHTQSEAMDIFLSIDSNMLTVEIRNQHKGYQGAKPQQSDIKLGQESLQNRLAEINAKLVWEEPGEDLQTAKIIVAI